MPALLIFNDPSYETTLKSEHEYLQQEIYPSYLRQSKEGKRFNICFVGVALLQLPFFLLATLVSWLFGTSITGYSDVYSTFFYLGSLTYSILGIIYFRKSLFLLFPNQKYLDVLVIMTVVATPLLYYTIGSSMSHNLSIFLFSLFTYLILKIKSSYSTKRFVFLAVIFALIILVRPTNAIIVLMIPFLLGSKNELIEFFKNLLSQKMAWLIAGSCFISILGIQLFIWKWQTDSWLLWSYGGQGFNWFNPQVFRSLIGFRTGVLLHTPIVVLGIFGAFILIKKNKFQAFFWFLYIGINVYVISSWWTWDYASSFGARAYTEHLIFILIPCVYVLNFIPRISFVFVAACTLLSLIRYTEKMTGFMPEQRFTASNYVPSLQFWKKENKQRWQNLISLVPFGENIDNRILFQSDFTSIAPETEFTNGSDIDLKQFPEDARYFVKIELEKKIIKGNTDGIFIVIDIYSSKTDKRNYFAIPMYQDKLEDQGTWVPLTFQDYAEDNLKQFDKLKCYIWNSNKSIFELRNFKCELQVYQ